MPLNKLDNFIKNTEGRILYVSPSDLDSTDSIDNQGNSLARPFKTIQRALIEAARFSYLKGDNNDVVEKTTILLMPGEHIVDNRPGYRIYNDGGTAKVIPAESSQSGSNPTATSTLSLSLNSIFDLTQTENDLIKFNSINGGVIVPRGTSIVGLDLRKTKIRPKYVPNPTDPDADKTAIFRITGACYFWQFCIFDALESGLVYTNATDFTDTAKPTFSHHKLTCFEYADGVNEYADTGLTDLDMYYAKLGYAFGGGTNRPIEDDEKYPTNVDAFAKQRPEWEIVGAFDTDNIAITSISISTSGSNLVTVVTDVPHQFIEGTPIKIRNVVPTDYNISTKVQNIIDSTTFTYLIPGARRDLEVTGSTAGAEVTIETDTVSGASPYIFNISLRSIWGMNGMHADGSKASGFRSMVVAQFTGVSLQKDDRAFVKYFPDSRTYIGNSTSKVTGATLSTQSSSTTPDTAYHLDSSAIYRSGWDSSHIKTSNDGFIQIVSVFAIGFTKHFDCESGGDLSITNSNSNFGQISLNSEGFRAEAFAKDNNAFITNILTPRSIVSSEKNIDWISIDVGVTTTVGVSTHLYLYGFTSEDDVPPILTQGYRVGAKVGDKLYVELNNVEYSANILMSDGSTSSVKEYSATLASNKFTIGANTVQNGEKVIIISQTGDLPENITEHTVYYAITSSVNSTRSDGVTLATGEIQLASSESDASLGIPITAYLGKNLKICSRVSDKQSGDAGHPVQFDSTNKQWYINSTVNNQIYTQLSALGGVGVLGDRTDPSYIKRIPDSRSLDEKIYKLRVVIPKELSNAKAPEPGFIFQESSTTGVRTDGDFTLASIRNLTTSDYKYNRNPRFIAKCTRSAAVSGIYTVTIVTEIPHNLQGGDEVIIRNVKDSTINPSGEDNSGYNGKFTIKSVTNDMTFTYEITSGVSASATMPTSKTSSWPRFERSDLKSNIYIYRSIPISNYIEGQQDGIYHVFALNANNAVESEFTNITYSQNVVDFYPQLDRDNVHDNPPSAKTYAVRSPLGKVVTNDLKSSLTRETTDKLLTTLGIGLTISSVSTSSGVSTITFAREHSLAGIVTATISNGGAGYSNGTYYNVKILADGTITNTWQGATANVVISGGTVTSISIVNGGSGYTAGTYELDESVIGNNGASTDVALTVTTSGISSAIGRVVQFTGAGTTSDTYHRITSIPAANQIAVAKTSGDTGITTSQYAFVVGPSISIASTAYSSATGITTFNCANAHGLVAGNKFRVIDSNNNNRGDYIVRSRVGVNTFTALTNTNIGIVTHILKHGLSGNDGISDQNQENLEIRGVSLFDDEIAYVTSFVDDQNIRISLPTSGIGTVQRFPYGSYIQIDEEIMRVASSTLGGTYNDEITVIRGALATRKTSHDPGSLIRKIKPVPVEFRRPSIIRASGHTFEYLGYGPGNYSTGLPQIQIKSLSEREEFLVQSQERKGGIVVYTGMNNRGDFFIGNQKKTSTTGEEVTFDTPVPTVTGEDPSRLSVVFDEVTVKERLVVEGGNSNTVLSQFDGPVTFNREINFNDDVNLRSLVKITDETQSTTTKNGSLTTKGGVGIEKNLNVGGQTYVDQASISGITTITNTTQSTSKDTGALVLEGGIGVEKNIVIGGKISAWNITTQGTAIGGLHIGSVSGTTNAGPALTFGARDASFGTTAQAGIYINSDGTYGTRMYFATTDSYASGAKNALTINEFGNVSVTRGTFTASSATITNGLTVNGGNVEITNALSVNGNTTLGDASTDTVTINATTTANESVSVSQNKFIRIGDAYFSSGSGGTVASKYVHIANHEYYNGSAWVNPTTTAGGLYQIAGQVHNWYSHDGAGNHGNALMSLDSSGNLTVKNDITAFYTSDQRLKDNITPIEDPLAKVLSISGNTYTWNEKSGKEGNDIGVIAQEVLEVLPEAVTTRDNGYLAVRYEKLVPLLVEAIKELSHKVEVLEQKLQDK